MLGARFLFALSILTGTGAALAGEPSAQGPVILAQAQTDADRIRTLEERIKQLEKSAGQGQSPTTPPSSGTTSQGEKEIPGWRVRLYDYTPDGDLRFKSHLYQYFFLNSRFDFKLGHDSGRDGLKFTYRYEAIYRATKPGTYAFAVDLKCNEAPNISGCIYVARVDGNTLDSFTGRNLNGRRTFEVPVSEPRELKLDLTFTGSQQTYIKIVQSEFKLLALVRAPQDFDFRDFAQQAPSFELFNRVPANFSVIPGHYPEAARSQQLGPMSAPSPSSQSGSPGQTWQDQRPPPPPSGPSRRYWDGEKWVQQPITPPSSTAYPGSIPEPRRGPAGGNIQIR